MAFSWFTCQDGRLIQPADFALLLTIPSHSMNDTGTFLCTAPDPFTLPQLTGLLPPPSKYFSPEDLVDNTIAMILFCLLITLGMTAGKITWDWIDPRFSSIIPAHKKWYVVANLCKATVLSWFALSPGYWNAVWSYFGNDVTITTTDIITMKRCAVMYVATDIVALYMVPKLPRSTILHHVVTATLTLVLAALNFQQNVLEWTGIFGMCKMGLVYGFFSTLAFPVNAYLGLRVVYPNATWLPTLTTLSLVTYVICCGGNWPIQLFWLMKRVVQLQISFTILLQAGLFCVMANDDVVLIRWLIRRGTPMDKDSVSDKKK